MEPLKLSLPYRQKAHVTNGSLTHADDMSRKRRSSELQQDFQGHRAPPARVHTSPTKHGHFRLTPSFDQDLETICRGANISLSDDMQASAAVIGVKQQICDMFRLLWYKNKPALEQAINAFLDDVADYTPLAPIFVGQEHDRKLENLRQKLSGPAKDKRDELRTPKAVKTKDVGHRSDDREDTPLSPPSPSQGRGLKSAFKTAKSAPPQPPSTKMPPPPQKPDPVISFDSTLTRKSSFESTNAGSVLSANTALTSFSVAPGAQRISDYGSVVPTDVLDALTQESKTKVRESNASSLGTDIWGSSLNTVDFDHAENTGYIRSQGTITVLHRDAEPEQVADAILEAPADPRLMRFSPSTGFAQLQIPDSFANLPFHVQWEAHRVLQLNKISLYEVISQWQPQSLARLYEIAAHHKLNFRPGFDAQEPPNFEEVTMNGQLQFAKSSTGPVFDVVLQAPKQEVSCDLQRRYGADRVLYMSIPDISKKPPQQHVGREILKKFQDMATKPQSFCGRQWIMYSLQPNKMNSKSKTRKSQVREQGAHRIIFLAIEGLDVAEVFDYLLPYQGNRHQSACKLYTRLDLYVSRTKVGTQFDEGDVVFQARDQVATNELENDPYRDPDLGFYDTFFPGKVMSDGCAELSRHAHWKICEQLGIDHNRSAFQARIGGAKGVWYRAAEIDGSFDVGKPPGPHITVVQSQIKVQRDSLEDCDPDQRKFNVVKANSYARPSLLHAGFMPILLDRGVPRQIMLDVARTQIKAEVDACEAAIVSPDPLAFRMWLHSQNELYEERNRTRDGGIDTVAGWPIRREERIIRLLESGFVPTQCPYLARDVIDLVKYTFDLKQRNFKIRLGRSTTLMGIADPKGCLEPGEVHVNFSAPFIDPVTKEQFQNLSSPEVKYGLVARNPAMAAWDIQRIRFVYKPELKHLTDLAVFSSRGPRPLASKLQGGDYDGDTFWICWDKKLATLFKNAPAPWSDEEAPLRHSIPSVEQLGIRKKTQRLCDFVEDSRDLGQWCHWLGEMGIARLSPNLLGQVTKLHERLTYTTGDINSYHAKQLVYLHDYLVDADKQGYEFEFAALNDFKKSIELPTDLQDPRYWKYTTDENENDLERQNTTYNVSKLSFVPMRAGKEKNIIDEVYFDVAEPLIRECIARVEDVLCFEAQEDEDLTRFYDQTWDSASEGSVIRTELQALKKRLQEVRSLWGELRVPNSWFDLLTQVRQKYEEIQPQDVTHPTVVEWLRRQGTRPTMWDQLKACAFAKLFQRKGKTPGQLVFSIAGHELCEIKATELGPTRTMCDNQYRQLKLRKAKKVEVRDEYEFDAGADVPDKQLDDDEDVEPTDYY
ncbi:RNA polymerase-like protein [Zymoseptoria brevis]|uniref:RNA-dependent RNA polymerase n=1 Tax=Zymoseptoria brevis TaxID=1047168 RepID=A0A0F4G619_9PEZI|nr:RNA polymerase-like protein [Zymoseptoria brevis]